MKGGDKGGEDAAISAADDVLSIVEGEEVGGVVFSAVAARRPELKRELGILRQALLLEEQAAAGGGGDGDGSEELKVRTNRNRCLRTFTYLSPSEVNAGALPVHAKPRALWARKYTTISELSENRAWTGAGGVVTAIRSARQRRFQVRSGPESVGEKSDAPHGTKQTPSVLLQAHTYKFISENCRFFLLFMYQFFPECPCLFPGRQVQWPYDRPERYSSGV